MSNSFAGFDREENQKVTMQLRLSMSATLKRMAVSISQIGSQVVWLCPADSVWQSHCPTSLHRQLEVRPWASLWVIVTHDISGNTIQNSCGSKTLHSDRATYGISIIDNFVKGSQWYRQTCCSDKWKSLILCNESTIDLAVFDDVTIEWAFFPLWHYWSLTRCLHYLVGNICWWNYWVGTVWQSQFSMINAWYQTLYLMLCQGIILGKLAP